MTDDIKYTTTNFSDNLSERNKEGEKWGYVPNELDKIKLTQRLNNEFFDNAGWQGIANYGKGITSKYYFGDKPTEYELWRMSRYNPLGHRIVWGFTGDIWNNNFGLEYTEMDKTEQDKRNTKMEDHFRKIGFWDEWHKLTGFDREQGESIVIIFRKGVGLAGLINPADITKEVFKLETIAKQDYTITQSNGKSYYRINFYRDDTNMKHTYSVHVSNAIRLSIRKYDYEQYPGASALEPVFGNLQVLSGITRAIGEAMYRWGPGKPAYFVKQGSERKLTEIKKVIGDPTLQSWHLIPENWISKIQMLGLEGTMPDMANITGVIIDNISGGCEVPAPILIGKVAGVQEGSIVNERSYFGTLDKYHSKLDSHIYKYFELDPFMVDLIGGNSYKVDWGLQYVMSIEDRVKYEHELALLGQALSTTHTLNEVRSKQGAEPIEKRMTDEECMEIYGVKVTILGKMLAVHVAALRPIVAVEQDKAQQDEEQEDKLDPTQSNSDNDGGGELNKQQQEKKMAKEVTDKILNFKKLIGMHDFLDFTGLTKPNVYNLLATLEDRKLGKIT